MANKRASAATVFSPPDSCSMSRKRFMGGIAWYLIPAIYGSCESCHEPVTALLKRRTYFTVLQTQVCHSAHGRSLTLCQVLVNLINALGNVVVCLVEEIASLKLFLAICNVWFDENHLRCLTSLKWSRALFESFRALSASFSVSASFCSTSPNLNHCQPTIFDEG